MSGTLLDALNACAARRTARFHMPGHKGVLPPPFDAVAPIDFTELDATGNLYTEENGAIREAEARAAALYGAQSCLFLTGGATQGVFAMLAASTSPGDTVLIDRTCHKSVFHAMAMLDLRPVYLRRAVIEPFGIGDGLEAKEPLPESACLLVTSPTYYGVRSDLAALAALCHRRGMRLLVDAAHGAHLPMLEPQPFLADIAVYSAHKTLAALGQAAFLLAGPGVDAARLRDYTSVFGTSSPSYPILASLDGALSGGARADALSWQRTAAFAEGLRAKLSCVLAGGHVGSGGIDPTRLCVYTGDGYASALRWERELGVVCEMADARNVVLILTPSDGEEALARLERALEGLSGVVASDAPPGPLPESVMTPREAFFAERETVSLGRAAGRIAARAVAPYPPGAPLVAMGEKFDKVHVDILKSLWYNEDELIDVVR